MAKLYLHPIGHPSRKTKKPASQIWKDMLIVSCLLNILQFVAYILKN